MTRTTCSRLLVLATLALAGPGVTTDTALARGDIPDLPQIMDDRGGPAPLFAIRPPNVFTHNVGLLQLQITNIGMIGNRFLDAFSAGWRGGEYLYAAGLWIGAKGADGVPHVSEGVYATEFLPPPDPVWTVYEGFEGIEGGNRLGFAAGPREYVGPNSDIGLAVSTGANDDYDDEGDTHFLDEDFLNGLDDDDDGRVDEDFEAIGQQMFACQYWDIEETAQEINPDHEPLGLLVQQRSFAWATSGANEFVGFDFRIWNISDQALTDVFVSFFVDSDCGPKDSPQYWVDDKGGFVSQDTTFIDETIDPVIDICNQRKVKIDVAYMFDTPDNEINEEDGGRGGDVPGYFGGMFLGHTTDPSGINAPSEVRIRRGQFFSGSEPYPQGDPRNDIERYDLISGIGVNFRETPKPADYRYVISAGPFRSLPPDTFLTFQTAFVIGDGRNGMLENAIQAQLIYDGVWRDVDDNPETGVGGQETCLPPPGEDSYSWTNPCDSLATPIRIVGSGYCAPENFVNDDCDLCTPLALQTDPGPETRINWVGTVAPPPPRTNTDAGGVRALTGTAAGEAAAPLPGGLDAFLRPGGDRRVLLQWDNLSELKADPIQRKILFEGYRLWRVEGWNRPVGSSGPGPDDWQKIGELLLNPESPPDTCWVPDPTTAGARVPFTFNTEDFLGNWRPDDPEGLLPDDPCDACPQFCWPRRPFYKNELLPPDPKPIATGDTTPGFGIAYQYPVGLYTFVDSAGIKNGMIYFYDVTAFSAWVDIEYGPNGEIISERHFELSGRPAARESQRVVPTWPAQGDKNNIYVVPNPYVQGDRNVLPDGWDLIPSDADPTGTRLAFTNLPEGQNTIKIYTLAGDLVETLEHYATGESGTVFWNLVSRNGQDVTAGIYMYTVQTETQGTKVGRFVIIR